MTDKQTMIDSTCSECDGEGFVVYGNCRSSDDGTEEAPCPKCYPEGYDDSDDRYDTMKDLELES